VWAKGIIAENDHRPFPLADFARINGQSTNLNVILFGIGQVNRIEPKTIHPRGNSTQIQALLPEEDSQLM
jgi:hypothetical protein